MKEIYNLLKKHNIKPFSYKKNGNVFIVDSSEGKYVIKKIKNKDIFSYLDSRSFNYYPKYVLDNDYLIMEYLEEESISNDQKMADLIQPFLLGEELVNYNKGGNIELHTNRKRNN